MGDDLRFFSIDWLSEHDGPGKRVVIFFQGCSLDCSWCHSPHSQPKESPLLFFEERCLGCKRCVEVCEQNVHQLKKGIHTLNRSLCVKCGRCVQNCPNSQEDKASALSLPTQSLPVDLLFEKIEPQLELLGDHGGVTFSGGEALLQVEALSSLAKRCKEAGFHTALETSGVVSKARIDLIAPYIDTWLLGMRLTTGTQKFSAEYLYQRVKNTFTTLSQLFNVDLIVRIPAIGGYTNTDVFLEKVRTIIGSTTNIQVDVMPINPSTEHYYQASGIHCSYPNINKKEADENVYVKLIHSLQSPSGQGQ